ncbi:hypothetical protein ABH925_002025 [Streptacidiphilus sp. EB129]|jgi:hypothetical protein
MQALGWGFAAERFARAAVEFGGDGVQVFAGIRRIGRLRYLRMADMSS